MITVMMFDVDPTLKPRDIIVMVSDINAYSPVDSGGIW